MLICQMLDTVQPAAFELLLTLLTLLGSETGQC